MNKRVVLIALFALVAASILTSDSMATPVSAKTITGKLLRADPTHGWIALTVPLTATTISHDTGFFYFTGLAPVTIGFDPDTGTNMTDLTVGSQQLTVTLSHAGNIRVYSGWGPSILVVGGIYSYFSYVTTVTTTGPGPVTIYYGIPSTGHDPTLVNSTTISGYLALGDYIGLIFAPYILLLGDMFGGLMMLAIMMPLYNRTQSLDYCLIVWVLLSAALTAALPLMTYRLAYVFLILGVASLLYRMLVPRG
jgi:hypothetical protein